MRRLHDKRAQMEAAWRVGVDTPKTVFVDSVDDLERGVEEIGFPCIFKPVESLAFKTRFRRHVLEIGSAEELRETYAKVDDCGTLMLQDIVPGGDEELYTLGSYLDARSRPLAVFTGHKLRQHPPRFGHVSMAVSRWVPELAEAGLRLLHELGYHGVSQVEFKRDPRDGSYRLMEVNARHWMWHSLGTACGVNLSLAAYRDAIGEPYISARQVDGLKWVVSLTDARDAFSRWRKGDEKLIPWLKSYQGVKVDGLFSLRDPCPRRPAHRASAEEHRAAQRQARRGRVPVRVGRFLAAAAQQPPAAVFQVSYACGLDIVRDLGRHGVPVLALDPDPAAIGLRSRYAAGIVCPDPLADEEAFLTYLETLGAPLPQRAVVFPSHDEFIWPLSRHAARLEPWFIVPFSGWDVMSKVHDKRAQMEAAGRAGVDTPKTVFVSSGAELEAAAGEIRFPAVLKPVESLAFKLRFHRHILDVESPAELQRIYDKVDDLGVLMLQERIPGGEDELWTVGSYLDAESRPLAVFTGHKLRQYPHAGGSCLAGVSAWDEGLAEAALRLLQELRFHGVSQVEFKRDPRDGRFCLMEVNARHWKWHGLAARCGVNLSYAAYRDAIGDPYIAPRQQDGVKWIVANKDVPLALLEIAKRQRSAGEYVRTLRGTRRDGLHALARPVPGLLNAGTVARQVSDARPRARADV